MKVLLVEENKDLIESIKKILAVDHIEADVVFNGLDIIQKISSCKYEAILISLKNLEGNNLNSVKSIKDLVFNLPILLILDEVDEENFKKANLKHTDFILKPLQESLFLNKLSNLLKRKSQVFERYELKYMLNKDEYEFVKSKIEEEMHIDQYGRTTIQSIYFDTPSNYLIRRSIEKPLFKEKIRLRSYGLVDKDNPCFLELKRKSQGLVYKRRIQLKEEDAQGFFENNLDIGDTQIAKELKFFKKYYKDLKPSYMIIYERDSYQKDGWDGRITFDMNPRYRLDNLNLHTSFEGTPLFEEETYLLEIKIHQNMPLWLTKILTEAKLTKRSYSKYGSAYVLERRKELEKAKTF